MFNKFLSLAIIVFGALPSAFASSSNEVVGSLPYSNQWEYEKAQSYLFVVYDPQSFNTTQLQHGDFTASLASNHTSFIGLNYFTQLASLSGLETFHHGWSAWLRFSLGFASPSTSLRSDITPISDASNTGQLFMGKAGAGPMLTWDLFPYFTPFLGAEVWGYFYRHTSSISSADFSGQGLMIEPMLGFESRLIEPLHAMAQVGFNRVLSHGSDTLMSDNTSVSLGIGAVF